MVIVAGMIVLEELERLESVSTPSEQFAQRPIQIFPSLRVCAVGCESSPVSPNWVEVAWATELFSNEKDRDKQRKKTKRSINRGGSLMEFKKQLFLTLRNDKIN
jgi:hypothetical protein